MSTSVLALLSPSRLVAHLRSPLFRNAYALVLSTATTSALGMVYWILAARLYSPEALGLNSAALSTMFFLSSLSQLGLGYALNRFVPRLGGRTRRLILLSYLTSLLATLVAGGIYLLGINFWSPSLGFLSSSPQYILAFLLACMAWGIFSLQDSAMVGLRQATWVPLENTIYGLLKIGLLLALASILPQNGIFASWILPLLLLILLINFLIFRHLIPRHIGLASLPSEPVSAVQVIRFVAGNYFSSLMWMAATALMPVIVLEQLGPQANAYFYLSWTIAYSLYLVSVNMGQSLTAESVADPASLESYSYRSLVQTARLLLPAVGLVVLAAPFILRLFGPVYAAQGTTLLRLLALSTLPNIFTALYLSILRVKRKVKAILLLTGALCSLALGLGYLLLGVMGITGVGLAWLVSQSLVAIVVLFTGLRPILLAQMQLKRMLHFFERPRWLWWHWLSQRHIKQNQSLIQHSLQALPSQSEWVAPGSWLVQRAVHTGSDRMVLALGPQDKTLVALSISRSTQANLSLQKQALVLAELYADPRLADWHSLLPEVLAQGTHGGKTYQVTAWLPGVDARLVLSDQPSRQRMLLAAITVISQFHQCTATSLLVDAGVLERWIYQPVANLRPLYQAKSAIYGSRLEHLATDLSASLLAETLPVSWIHGDFWPANFLVTPDGDHLTGIIDWDQASSADLPFLDLFNLLISTRMHLQQRELGDVIVQLIEAGGWSSDEGALLDLAHPAFMRSPLSMRQMLLYYWLRHLSANLTKSQRFAHHPLWLVKNFEGVIKCL